MISQGVESFKLRMILIQTVLSLSENVLESRELDVVSLLSPSKGAKDARAEAIIGERMEESFEKRDSGSSPCWYS